MQRPRASDAVARRTSFLVLALFVVGSLAGSLHMALVRHAVCAEHGELVEVAPSSAGGTCDNAKHIRHPASWTAAPGAIDGEHEHCQIATQARERVVAWTPIRVVARTEPTVVPRVCATCPARLPAVSPLFLAPKHSPPI